MYSSTLVREGQLTVMSPSSGRVNLAGEGLPEDGHGQDISRRGRMKYVLFCAMLAGVELKRRSAMRATASG